MQPAELDARVSAIVSMIEKYTAGLDTPVPIQPTDGQPKTLVVLVTGTTGNLGAQMLAELLQDSQVEKVYAFNRASRKPSRSMLQRHQEQFLSKSLDAKLLASKKLVFVEGDATSPDLGISKILYEELHDAVTIIIHNAWRLGFSRPISSFEPNIRATRVLVDFARSSPHASSLRFLFTSSIGFSLSWDKSEGKLLPEEIIRDPAVAVGNGYGEGKYVAEMILDKSGLQYTTFRISQITGGLPNGDWGINDAVPGLIVTGLTLGALPSFAGVISWLPMHAVSKGIVEVAFSQKQLPPVLNFVHPRPVGGDTLFSWIRDELVEATPSLRGRLGVMPFPEWLDSVAKRYKIMGDAEVKLIPAVRILEFWSLLAKGDRVTRQTGRDENEMGGFARYVTEKAEEFSPTMKDLTPLDVNDVKRWVQYWHKAGLSNFIRMASRAESVGNSGKGGGMYLASRL